MSAAPLEVVQKLADAQDVEIRRLTARVAVLEAELERIGRAAVEHHGETECDVAQAGFNHLRALAARAGRTT